MSTEPTTNPVCPEPALLALAPSLDALAHEVNRLVSQLDRLYEQRHFELLQKYGTQFFLDFRRHDQPHRHPVPPESSPASNSPRS